MAALSQRPLTAEAGYTRAGSAAISVCKQAGSERSWEHEEKHLTHHHQAEISHIFKATDAFLK